MNLYWVATEDHAEEAATFHEEREGYDYGDATAEMILEIQAGITAEVGWPSDDVLHSCGANIIPLST